MFAVVPLHAKDALPVKDIGLIGTGQKTAYEYDGLESGELAWVLGKQFPVRGNRYPQTVEYSSLATQMPRSAPGAYGAPRAGAGARGADGADLVPHLQPNGFGPDRMQRLAYTAWMESHFLQRTGRQTIDLKAFDMFSPTAKAIDSELNFWSTHGAAGSDLFALPDLAYAFQSPTSDPAKNPLQIAASQNADAAMPQGLFVMERGPFLRSIGTDRRAISIEAQTETGESFISKQMVDRHLGSELAQKGLEVALKEHGVFNWVPDGICLSKYETGPNGQADAEHDARASQLFNVAVQGPAITKTWTHDPKMQCMPMDKVFMLVVADLSYTIQDAAANVNNARDQTIAMRDAVRNRAGARTKMSNTPTVAEAAAAAAAGRAARGAIEIAVDGPIGGRPGANGPMPNSEVAFTDWVGRGGTLPAAGVAFVSVSAAAGGPVPATGDGILLLEQLSAAGALPDAIDRARARAEELWTAYRATFGFGAAAPRPVNQVLEDAADGFDATAASLRRGEVGVGQAKLGNFRLMRATSSFLAQYSHYSTAGELSKDPRDSRCGLPIEFRPAVPGPGGRPAGGGGSYIVGGWCIGTVLDSAASRSVYNGTVRTAPASMALNIAVNIEWWNADKLYQHYQDTEKYTKSTQGMVDAGAAVGAGVTPNKFNVEDVATVAQAATEKGAGTVAERSQMRESTSEKYSLDLDVEAYPADVFRPAAARPQGARFRRGWTGVRA